MNLNLVDRFRQSMSASCILWGRRSEILTEFKDLKPKIKENIQIDLKKKILYR
jgi:hypothetical protein